MLKFADGQTDGRTDRVITIVHPPSDGALMNGSEMNLIITIIHLGDYMFMF